MAKQATMAAPQASYLTGTTPERATLILSGTIEARNQITGTITSPDSGYSGRFVGRLFGPQGAELGVMIELTRGDGTRQIGIFTAAR